MKTIKELENQDPVFLNNWEDSKRFGVIEDFEDFYLEEDQFNSENPNDYIKENIEKMKVAIENHKNEKIIFASYGYENYSGDAFVLIIVDGKLFEVNGSHCSCYGLEDQWDLEETSLKALKHRIEKGELGNDDYSENIFKDALIKFLGIKDS